MAISQRFPKSLVMRERLGQKKKSNYQYLWYYQLPLRTKSYWNWPNSPPWLSKRMLNTQLCDCLPEIITLYIMYIVSTSSITYVIYVFSKISFAILRFKGKTLLCLLVLREGSLWSFSFKGKISKKSFSFKGKVSEPFI